METIINNLVKKEERIMETIINDRLGQMGSIQQQY